MVERIQTFVDGGSICIEFVTPTSIESILNIEVGSTQQTNIFLDRRINTDTLNSFWVGYPGKEDSFMIKNESSIQEIKKQVTQFQKYNNNLIACILSV